MPCLDGFKYFKVIYSLQSDPFCYFITFSYIFMTTPRVCRGEPKIKKIIIKQLLSYQLFLLVYVVNHWYTSNILIHWKDPSYVLKLDGSDSKHLTQHIVSVVNIWRIINTVAQLHLVRKFARVFPWTLSVPRSSQFSSSFTLGELFASWNTLYSTFVALPVRSLVFLVI